MQPNLEQRLEALSARLDRIESKLGMTPIAAAEKAAPPVAPPTAPTPTPEVASAVPPAIPVFAPPTAPPPAARVEALAAKASRFKEMASRAAHAPKPKSQSLESLIGARWYAAAGAIILVIGIGLGFKWAYDNGYLKVAPLYRCLGGVGFGVLLLIAGEYLRKRFNEWAGAGATAAGIGTIFVSTYVSYKLFDLLGPAAAFGLLAATAGLGIFLAARSRLATVGVISLLGGYITPLLFWDRPSQPIVLPSYLLTLLVTALVLSAWRRGTFVTLRITAWCGTLFLGGIWSLAQKPEDCVIAVVFLALTWAAFHTELVIATRRNVRVPTDEQDDTEPESTGPMLLMGPAYAKWRPIVVSLSTTLWVVVLGVFVVRKWGEMPDWTVPAAATAACAGLWFMLAGHLRLLSETPKNDPERLGATLAFQAGASVFATIALALSSSAEVACWIAVGLAGLAAGRSTQSRAVAAYGLASLAFGTARLVVYDAPFGNLHLGSPNAIGLVLTPWTALMAFAAAVWFTATRLFPARQNGGVHKTLAVIGMLTLMASLLHIDASPGSVCIAWLVLSCVALFLKNSAIAHGLAVAAFVGLAFTTGAWIRAYVVEDWSDSTAMLLLHPGLIVGLAISAAWAVGGWFLKRDATNDPKAATFAAGIGLVLLFSATSLEAARIAEHIASDSSVQAAGVSIWWGIFAIGLLCFGFLRRNPALRWSGLALLGAAGLKAVILDLAGVPLLFRVISFLGLGLMMIAVPVVYSKLGKSLEPENPPEPPTTDTPPLPTEESAG